MCLATKWCHRCSSQNCIYYFGTSILVMVCLVACSHACVVSSYQKCETVVESSVVRNTLMPERGGDCHALFTATGRQQCDKLPAGSSYNNGDQGNVSQHIFRLFRMGLRIRLGPSPSSGVPMLTACHRRQRMKWAQDH